MAEVLYGSPVRDSIKVRLQNRVLSLGFKPTLAIIQSGDRPDSNLYIKNKIKFGEDVGINVILEKQLPTHDLERDIQILVSMIEKLNTDTSVNGIIVQLPLPTGFDSEKILQHISKEKDADGLIFHEMVPATAKAVMSIFDFYNIEIKGKKAAVIGRSRLAGAPIAKELEKAGALVTVCHRGTQNMAQICKSSEILVSAAGHANLVTEEFTNDEQVVIDVGINRLDGKLVGDVDFESVSKIARAITPVPGGIGPLTVGCLFENLLDLAERKI